MNRLKKLKFVREQLEACQRVDKDFYRKTDGFDRSVIKVRMNRRARFLETLKHDPLLDKRAPSFLNKQARDVLDSNIDYLFAMINLKVTHMWDEDMTDRYYKPILMHSALKRYGLLLEYGI